MGQADPAVILTDARASWSGARRMTGRQTDMGKTSPGRVQGSGRAFSYAEEYVGTKTGVGHRAGRRPGPGRRVRATSTKPKEGDLGTPGLRRGCLSTIRYSGKGPFARSTDHAGAERPNPWLIRAAKTPPADKNTQCLPGRTASAPGNSRLSRSYMRSLAGAPAGSWGPEQRRRVP